jgi:hypothetical protein
MLDPPDQRATCIARAFEPWPIPVLETAGTFAIEWNADYELDGDAFTVIEWNGAARIMRCYPTAEIRRLIDETPTERGTSAPEPEAARERLDTGQAEAETGLLPEIQSKLDALWDEFDAAESPSADQMNAFLERLLLATISLCRSRRTNLDHQIRRAGNLRFRHDPRSLAGDEKNVRLHHAAQRAFAEHDIHGGVQHLAQAARPDVLVKATEPAFPPAERVDYKTPS